jgi:GxxExxY protein
MMTSDKTARIEDDRLTERIIGCAYRVGNELGNGFLEKVYENALVIELEKDRLKIKRQYPITIRYQNKVAGEYVADLLAEDKVLVELKAVVWCNCRLFIR